MTISAFSDLPPLTEYEMSQPSLVQQRMQLAREEARARLLDEHFGGIVNGSVMHRREPYGCMTDAAKANLIREHRQLFPWEDADANPMTWMSPAFVELIHETASDVQRRWSGAFHSTDSRAPRAGEQPAGVVIPQSRVMKQRFNPDTGQWTGADFYYFWPITGEAAHPDTPSSLYSETLKLSRTWRPDNGELDLEAVRWAKGRPVVVLAEGDEEPE